MKPRWTNLPYSHYILIEGNGLLDISAIGFEPVDLQFLQYQLAYQVGWLVGWIGRWFSLCIFVTESSRVLNQIQKFQAFQKCMPMIFVTTIWVFPKIGGKPPKWMIYNGSKPYFLMDDLGIFPYFRKHPYDFFFKLELRNPDVKFDTSRVKLFNNHPGPQGLLLLLVSGRVCQNWWNRGVHVLFTLMLVILAKTLVKEVLKQGGKP